LRIMKVLLFLNNWSLAWGENQVQLSRIEVDLRRFS
jgi:hypothetical protein